MIPLKLPCQSDFRYLGMGSLIGPMAILGLVVTVMCIVGMGVGIGMIMLVLSMISSTS